MSARLNINWVNISNLKKMNESPIAFSYNLTGIPTSFIINPDGIIIKQIESENDIKGVLEEIFYQEN